MKLLPRQNSHWQFVWCAKSGIEGGEREGKGKMGAGGGGCMGSGKAKMKQ